MIELSKRLALCGSFVRKGSKAADIGTDHAYLPIWLILSDTCKSVIAADINIEPLKKGKENIDKYKLSDKIKIVLSNGLDNINQNDAEDIIIAGMGGELIEKIITNCNWIKNNNINLILQPMTKPELLRSFLWNNGFYIKEEKAVICEKKIYSVINAVYTGEIYTPSIKEMYFGKIDFKNDLYAESYKKSVLSKLTSQYNGILKSKNQEKAKVLKNLLDNLE